MNNKIQNTEWITTRVRRMLVVLLCALLLCALPTSTSGEETPSFEWTTEVRNLLQALHISSPEFDSKEINVDHMIESIGDPYTQYFTNAESQKFLNAVNGDGNALGIEFRKDEEGNLYITRVEPGSPADRNGIVSGDIIVAVNEEVGSSDQLLKRLDGRAKQSGDPVTLSIIRGNEEILTPLAYENVHFSPVRSSMLTDGIGYVRLLGFTADADKPFEEALKLLESQGIKSLILDLRDNGGGYLETARRIASNFLEGGILMKTRTRSGDWETTIQGGRKAPYPLYVLVNERTASASEVLAGALQDRKAATIIGQTTYGKGVVQEMFPLLSGKGFLKITTKEYVTPNGSPVNNRGIIPDIQADGGIETLLRAVKLAGSNVMTFSVSKLAESLNGAEWPRQTQIIHMNGSLYAPARLLSGLIDASVTWQESTRSVLIVRKGVSISFSPDNTRMFLREGKAYLNIEEFRQHFPSLLIEEHSNGLTLIANP